MSLLVKRLTPSATLPTRGSAQAAGLDLYADKGIELLPHDYEPISTGIAIALPHGTVGLIRPRSGLAVRGGIDVLAGVIDSDYRGEIKVVLVNHGYEPVCINYGDRIAQLLIQRVEMLTPEEVDELPATVRGENGFGSTGR